MLAVGLLITKIFIFLYILTYFPLWQTISIIIAYVLIDNLICGVFGIERLSNLSATYLDPEPGNSSLIVGIAVVDKASMKEVHSLWEKFLSFPNTNRMKMKIVKYFGTYYWQKEREFRISDHIRKLGIGKVKSYKDLFQLMGKEMQRPLNPELSPWEGGLIEDFMGDKSVIYMSFHHALGDGIAIQNFVSRSSDVDPLLLHRFTPRSWSRKLVKILLFVPLAPIGMIKALFPKKTTSLFTARGRPLVGLKKSAFCGPFSLPHLKEVCREMNTTINNLILGCTLGAVKSYFDTILNCPSENKICLGIPYSLRVTPTQSNPISLTNNFSLVTMHLPLIKFPSELNPETEEYFQEISREANKLFRSKIGNLMNEYNMLIQQAIFPQQVAKYNILNLSAHIPIIYTNVAGSTTPLTFSGRRVHDIYYLAPSLGKNCINFSVASYDGRLHVMVNADVGRMPNVDSFVAFLDKNINMLLEGFPFLNDFETGEKKIEEVGSCEGWRETQGEEPFDDQTLPLLGTHHRLDSIV